MNETELRQALGRYSFYHVIQLTDTTSTAGNPTYVPAQNLCMKHLKSIDVKGKRVLDIGCRDGLFSFAAESMGATEVVGIDNDLSKGATELLIPYLKSSVRMYRVNLYDLTPETFGLFDVIIFPGVLYHLRYPFWGRRAIRDVLKIDGHLLIETAIWEGDRNNAMLFCPIASDSPYEETSCTFFNAKGLLDTLTSLGFQTVQMERLDNTTGSVTLSSYVKQFITCISTCFTAEDRPPIDRVTRSVVHSTYSGFDKNMFTARYWETTHDFHTTHGG
jgi:tRNA (mo5U34)-methyltransferase